MVVAVLLWAGPLFAERPKPVAHWTFGPEAQASLKATGQIRWNEEGPRPPEFPDFPKDNQAVRIQGKGSYLSLPDLGPKSPLQVHNGQEITLESWIRVPQIRQGQTFFIIGKGRNGQPGFPQDNLNWALRVAGVGNEARANFLFNTRDDAGKTQWHRWTSNLGFLPESGWHHVAVGYRFGEPDSIRAWIDGVPSAGVWEMAGPTRRQPPADQSDLWIGSSLRRDEVVSFDGWISAISVHRTLLSNAQVADCFRREGGPRLAIPESERMPEIPDVPPGRVLMTVAESLPNHRRWPFRGEPAPKEVIRWTGDSFLLPRLPARFDDWGIRATWKAPLLLTMAADVELSHRKQTFLLRARGLGRLWIDGKLITRTQADVDRQQSRGGRNPIFLHEPPLPGLRPVQDYMQEVTAEAVIGDDADDGQPRTRRVVLELVVGGEGIRTQTGETLLALLAPDGRSYDVLQAGNRPGLPLIDAEINAAVARIETSLTELDTAERRRAARVQDAFWESRHATARDWAKQNPAPSIPGNDAAHPVDAFLEAKLERARLAASMQGKQAEHFHREILPLLQTGCFRCHGERERGGLKLDSRQAALKAGDSELPAIVPGKPEQSEFITRLRSDDESKRMPPKGDGLTAEQVRRLEDWIRDGAPWPDPPPRPEQLAPAAIVGDAAFLRRISFDLVGFPPSAEEVRAFIADPTPDKRNRAIDRLLADPRMPGHWISYWLDALAENPSLLSTTMNSTGPFRWFLYDSLLDRKPLDRLVTELLMMRGGMDEGGSAGFSVAGENDAPLAEKGHIVAAAFLGVEMQCARCHDSPYHSSTQRDLFSLAAMLDRKSVKVPATSRVPAAFFEKNPRASLIRVTLRPDEQVAPAWPFARATGLADGPAIDGLMRDRNDSRERLAALITAPANRRFAQVVVNRIWKQLMGAGIVEPVHDWEGREPSHPELLDWLANRFVASGYDVAQVVRLITTSRAYQREAVGENLGAGAAQRFFQAPDCRRLSAEQVVDAMHAAVGAPMDVEELTFDPQGRWPARERLTLGTPTRAWMLADLKNERDRPSLSLPKARIVTDVLEAFSWNGARQKPVFHRETDANVLQPGSLANSVLTMKLIRASEGSRLAELAIDAESPEALVESLFLHILNRPPSAAERRAFAATLAVGFDSRRLPPDQVIEPKPPERLPRITWLNHAIPEANTIQAKYEAQVRRGSPPDPRLRPEWRAALEDAVWSLFNHREFVWLP